MVAGCGVEDDTGPKESSRGANETASGTRRCKRQETTHSSGDCSPNGYRCCDVENFAMTFSTPPAGKKAMKKERGSRFTCKEGKHVSGWGGEKTKPLPLHC